MQFFVLVLSLAATCLARPDVSHLGGYNYNSPTSNGGSFGVGSSNVPTGSYLPGQGGVDQRFTGIGGISGGSSGFDGGISGGGAVQDQKHVYFFAAPDEEAPARLRIQIAPSSQKNTKIIFIKAPSAGGVVPEVIAPPSQSEDKTLVYVLVKKQEQGQDITIPASASVKQAKPEVYFIKYRTKEEAEQAVAGGLSEQAVGSGVQSLSDEQAFVRTIKDDVQQGGNNGFGIETGSSLLGTTSGGSIGGGSISVNSGGLVNGGSSINGGLTSKYGPPSLSGPY